MRCGLKLRRFARRPGRESAPAFFLRAGMGTASARKPSAERRSAWPAAALCTGADAAVEALDDRSAVEEGASGSACPARPRTRFSHNTAAMHRGFPGGCGKRGKEGLRGASSAGICKSPELHSRDLENLPTPETRAPTLDHRYFHFSCLNYGYYCLFLFFNTPLPPPRRRPAAPWENSLADLPGSYAMRMARLAKQGRRKKPGNPEKHPCFPRAREREGEYNQEQDTASVSGGMPGVVEWGQRGTELPQGSAGWRTTGRAQPGTTWG